MYENHHHRYRELLISSLFDELGEEERIEFQNHLDGCEVCQADLRELRPVVVALENAAPEDARDELPAPPKNLETRTFARIGSEARGRRRQRLYTWTAAAAAAAVLVVVAGLVALVPLFGGPPTEPVAFSQVSSGVEAEASLIAHTWGTETVLVAEGLENGRTYEVTLTSADGAEVPSGTFVVTGEGPIECNLTAALLRENATRLRVLADGGEPVLEADLPDISESARSGSNLLVDQESRKRV